MKKIQYMLLVAGLWMAGTMCVMAQVPAANIRYVRMEKQDGTGGKYTNDGRTWATAKNNIQDAINSLVAAKALPGEVWVGEGTYRPTESTESSGGSTLYMSFKIPAGITVRGGFPADGKLKKMEQGANLGRDSLNEYITSPDQRPMLTKTEVGALPVFQTILTGDLSSQRATFVWNDTKKQYNTTFYGNSYHVVTFATNGFHPDGHAKALDTSKGEAALDGVIVEHGNAHYTATDGHPHEAYGGGIYMVKGSHVYNTGVRECEATRAGGAIYMDGGGIAEHVYVSTCQALGIGTTYGFGGGICMEDGTYEPTDPTKGMYPTVVRLSGVNGSVARNGGGLAIYCNNPAYKDRMACSAVVVANNTAQNEGGGIYMHQGGCLTQVTVVRNVCLGSGISVGGMVNGRSGGIYARDYANIANTVIWGNECTANRHVQFAGSRSGNENAKKPLLRCVMLSRADYADWSGVIKYRVNDLNEDNVPPLGRATGGTTHTSYPAFENPTPTAGYISDIYDRSLRPVVVAPRDTLPAYSWKVLYSSALTNAGVQTVDLDTAGVTPAPTHPVDIMGNAYASYPTLGAYTSTNPMVWPYMESMTSMHLYVDPNAKYANETDSIGNSWDNAAHSLSDVFHLLSSTLQAYVDKHIPATGVKIYVHVKEGIITNNGGFTTGRVRNNTLDIPLVPNSIYTNGVSVEILGGYKPDLELHDVSERNPLKYHTVITGDIVDDYAYNVAHLVTFDGTQNVTFDGFQLRNGNATSTKQENVNQNGAAFTIRNSQNITIKNCLVAHCQAEVGAAVYADNSTVDFENCIFHNNAATQQIGLRDNTPGIVYSGGTGALTFDHCDMLRNVGYGAWVGGTSTQTWTNSIFYGNMNAPVDDTNDNAVGGTHYIMATPAFGGTTANASGSYCLFDGKSAGFTQFTNSRFDLSYVYNNGANSDYPRFINPTKNAGITPAGDITYYGRATSFEPYNTNPMVNAAGTGTNTPLTTPANALDGVRCVPTDAANLSIWVANTGYADGQDLTTTSVNNWLSPFRYGYIQFEHVAGKADNIYYIHMVDASGNVYVPGGGWHDRSGILNITTGGNQLFIGGKNGQDGQDAANHGIWEVTYNSTEQAYVIKNVGRAGTYISPASAGSSATAVYVKLYSTLETSHSSWGTDISTVITRDYGGRPDIGAVENHKNGTNDDENAYADGQPAYGVGFYVRDYRTGGAVNCSAGGDGMSWAGAINGNAYYYPDGTHGCDPTKEVGTGRYIDHYRTIYNEGSAVNIPTTNGAAITVVLKNGSDYLMLQNNQLKTTTTIAEATEFTITCSRTGQGTSRNPYVYTYTIKAGSTGIGYSATNSGAKISIGTNSAWYADAVSTIPSGSSHTFANKTGTSNRKYLIANGLGTPAVTWTFYQRNSHEEFWYREEITGTVEGVIGLQYAVNTANAKFRAEGGTSAQKTTVWVGAGTYTNAVGKAAGTTFTSDEIAKHLVSQPYAFEMKEGVDVIGGFPGVGNPGEQQRDPKAYETILQPQTTSPYVTLGTHRKYSGSYEGYTPTNWGSCANATDGNEKASVGRVLVQANDFTVETVWDGFTIRYGYLLTARMKNIGQNLKTLNTANVKEAGGAGALLQGNGQLTNCHVTENLVLCYPNSSNMVKTGDHVNTKVGDLYTFIMGGAGVFMTGSGGKTAIVANCELSKNQILTKGYNRASNVPDNVWMMGAGLFQDNGNVYNTTIHDNDAAVVKGSAWTNSTTGDKANNEMVLGAGAFIADGNCYNNTVVNNKSATIYWCHNNHCTFAGVHVKDAARIYNTIVADNESHWGYEHYGSGTNPGNGVPVSAFNDDIEGRGSRDETKVHVTYSFVDVNQGTPDIDLVSYNDRGAQGAIGKNTNIYLNREQGSATNRANRYTSDSIYYRNGAAGTTSENIYHLKPLSPAINTGTENIPGVTIPDVDAEYKDRVMDCVIDMGAYEYNGAYDIAPRVVNDTAYFYVTPKGARLATATDPENAACADKLQKVLDAAGRYKFQTPGRPVIVKLANDYESQHPADPGEEPEPFTYYANRSVNPVDQDVRIWSVMVPRGVELWGGYTNLPMKMENGQVVRDTEHNITAWSNTYNGFYSGTTDLRDVTGNATYIDATYVNKLEHSTATTYHTVTFTDRIFDGNGNPYLAGDNDLNGNSSYDPNAAYENETFYKHMSDKPAITARAVLDGLFVTGGQADAPAHPDATLRNANQFGGAAIVEPYAHVRNCILENNSATYGGALALKDKALVSGCLIRDNTATRGAGIYVFENGTQLSENGRVGRYTVNTAQGGAAKMDANMPHIFLSTIVRNHAANQGGGLWFTNNEANVRVNSTVLWQNDANEQNNVAGAYSPDKPSSDKTTTVEFYPFAYSAVQNLRMSGTNNISLQNANKNGVRFAYTDDSGVENTKKMAADEDHFSDFGFYGLTDMSALARTGMSIQEYDDMLTLYNLAPADFMKLDRKVNADNAPVRSYVEIGARAIDKSFQTKQLMLRLYVAQPEDIDADVAQAMASMGADAAPNSDEEYYSQEGSSFAYPFQNLQDALDYIYLMRSTKKYSNSLTYIDAYHANDLPFEIMIAKGTYTPTRDLAGNYGESLANTFAIPEGVSLYGGFSVNARPNKWYGRYVQPKTSGPWVQKPTRPNTWVYSSANVDTIPLPSDRLDTPPGATASVHDMRGNQIELTIDERTYTIVQASAINMAAFRSQIDVNKNNIIEPWEFENQTILSGNATSAADQGVYHIVTICPDETVVGILPTISGYRDPDQYNAAGGYLPKEYGQYIQFNGLTFQGGRAHNYSAELDEMAKYNYYHGGAALIDGNRYNNNYNDSIDAAAAAVAAGGSWNPASYAHKPTTYQHLGRTNAVAYRDIMTTIANCRFYDNVAGYGGAISTNTELELFSSAFESNLASNFSDQVPNADKSETYNLTFAGQGGAVFTTYSLSAFNTLFANNEARDPNHTNLTSGTYYSYRNYKSGGSNELPGTGGAIYAGLHSNTHMFNCDVVRNMANSYPGVFTMNPNTYDGNMLVSSAAAYNQIANTVFWGNEVNATVKSANRSNNKLFAAQLAINYGAANRNIAASYDPFATSKYPTSQADLDDAANETNLSAKKFSEMLYFCAYEEGRGITAKNNNDFRQVSPHFYVHPTFTYSNVPNPAGGLLPYQNNNIAISADNDALDGPAFMRPSYSAGIDGYLEAADWSPARLNNLTDNGSGKLMQTISDVDVDGVPKKVADFVQYANKSQLPNRSIYSSDPVNAFTTENVGDYVGDGAYTMARYLANYPYYKDYLAIGTERYMRTSSGDEMHRISLDPNPTHDQTYVDIGVYEYIHVELKPALEDDVDILWVSNYEKPENGTPNGESWLRPTSDLQRAIETLLASRNGNRKEIRLCDGTYSPIYTINGTLSFYIDTKYLNQSALGGTAVGTATGKGVKSLVIKGGYSREYNGQHDVDLYPAIIRQQEIVDPAPKYDHLIYINDATQRYHGTYDAGTNYGWTNGGNSGVHTFPIQIDGVTLINDQAQAGVEGAAIYYRNPSFDASTKEPSAGGTTLATSTTAATVTTSAPEASPHTFADVTNPDKLIISKTTILGSGAKNGTKTTSAVYVGEAGGNVLIYNSLFHSNFGSPLKAANARLVNNTFALNEGQVQLTNYTSAEHAKDSVSVMFNNVLWRNNPTGGQKADVATSFGYQLEMAGLSHKSDEKGDFEHAGKGNIFAYNAYTGGNTADIDYDPSSGTTIIGNNHNVGLVSLNTDVTYGPNFNDPLNTTVAKRSFQISPSMRLLNKGSNELYGDTALAKRGRTYDLSWEVTKMYDITSSNRIAAGFIDLGAYEYQYELNRVLYVDPNKSASGDGLSWENALGFGNIQNAIDLAGVSHSNLNKSTYVFVKAASATNLDLHTGEVLTLRDGVQVYGSVMADYGVECPYTRPVVGSNERQYEDIVLDAYVADVLLYGRYGTISPVEGHTRISGINTNGTAFSVTMVDDGHGNMIANEKLCPTLIDGFEVMPKNTAAADITRPVLHITPYQSDENLATGNVQVGMRNIAVHGYNATNCNVAEIDNVLLYSTLFHHNTVTGTNAVLQVNQYANLLNATVEGKTTGTMANIFRSLVNYDENTRKTLSGYCYAMEDENMNYQLTEYSQHIDACENTTPAAITEQQKVFVHAERDVYSDDEVTAITAAIKASHDQIGDVGNPQLAVSNDKYKSGDRDLLGNFRWQDLLKSSTAGEHIGTYSANHIDRGAFETWRVERDHVVVWPNYPYPGTCEYVMAGKSLVIDPVDPEGDPTAAAHLPGFVLLQTGASLYGSGRELMISYGAIEREVKNGADLMLSTPWNQNMIYRGISDPKRNAVNGLFVVEYENGVLNPIRTNQDEPVYGYDAAARADWQSRMKPQDSQCWTPWMSYILPACTGVYTRISCDAAQASMGESMIVRCMSKGESMHDYIYTELVEPGHTQHTGKSVTLYRHDDAVSTNGGGDFTDSKNAGWNFIGYPYLVSQYHPYTKADVDANDNVGAILNPGVANTDEYADFLAVQKPYAMDRPQTMWLYYDGKVGPDGNAVDGTGGFYSVNSWLKEPAAWHVAPSVEPVLKVSEGFFVQTNTLQESEDLTFYRPSYRSHFGGAMAPAYSPYRYYVGDDNDNNGNTQPGIVSPEQVDSMLRGYEKLIRDQHVYIVRRDDSGRITEAYDLTGRTVRL